MLYGWEGNRRSEARKISTPPTLLTGHGTLYLRTIGEEVCAYLDSMTPDLDRLTGGRRRQTGSGEGVRAVRDEVLDAAAQTGADTPQTVADRVQLSTKTSTLTSQTAIDRSCQIK